VTAKIQQQIREREKNHEMRNMVRYSVLCVWGGGLGGEGMRLLCVCASLSVCASLCVCVCVFR
jgi:hypothetical protein